MVYYKLVKISFDAHWLAEVIIDVVIRHHGLPYLIVINRGSFFSSKFWSLLCYFLVIALLLFGINKGFLPLSTLRLTVRLSGKTVQWKCTSKPL